MEKNSKIHIIGIAGAGVSAVAVMLKDLGHTVTGSDEGFYEPTISYLKRHGINILTPYKKENIPEDADLIIIGKHSKLNEIENEEVALALENKERVKSFPEVLGEITKNRENIVVAGSYGKSTCTALIAWCLIKAKKDPSYFIGAIPIDTRNSSHMGKGKEFVLEGDEYPSANWDNTSKFLHLNPSSILLISAEHDHFNIFPTEKSYKEPYKNLVGKIPKDGLLVYSYEGKNNREIVKNAKCRKISYSLSNRNADWWSTNLRYSVDTTFDLINKGKKVVSLKTKLLGRHNIENIIGCGAFLLENLPRLGKAGKKIRPKDFANAVATFQGIKRRIELKNSRSKIPVYEGFGSSYAKAKSVFDALKLHYPHKRLVTVFEPKTFSWRNIATKKWYKDIFDTSDQVIILPPSKHGKNTHDQMSFQQILKEVKKNHPKVHRANNEKETLALLKKIIKNGDIIALVSSGSLLGLSESVPKLMEKMFPK